LYRTDLRTFTLLYISCNRLSCRQSFDRCHPTCESIGERRSILVHRRNLLNPGRLELFLTATAPTTRAVVSYIFRQHAQNLLRNGLSILNELFEYVDNRLVIFFLRETAVGGHCQRQIWSSTVELLAYETITTPTIGSTPFTRRGKPPP